MKIVVFLFKVTLTSTITQLKLRFKILSHFFKVSMFACFFSSYHKNREYSHQSPTQISNFLDVCNFKHRTFGLRNFANFQNPILLITWIKMKLKILTNKMFQTALPNNLPFDEANCSSKSIFQKQLQQIYAHLRIPFFTMIISAHR